MVTQIVSQYAGKYTFYMTLFEQCTKHTELHFNTCMPIQNTIWWKYILTWQYLCTYGNSFQCAGRVMYVIQNKLCHRVVGKPCLTARALLPWTENKPTRSGWDDPVFQYSGSFVSWALWTLLNSLKSFKILWTLRIPLMITMAILISPSLRPWAWKIVPAAPQIPTLYRSEPLSSF